MPDQPERFWYPFTATTVIARKLAPLLLFTLGIGLFLWAGHEYYSWQRPWAVAPEAALGVLAWLAAGYFFTLLPDIRADDEGLRLRRWGLFWRHIPWGVVADVRMTARVDLLGWVESFYTVYVWQARAGRRGRVRRDWHRRPVRAFRFSGHIRNCEQLLALIRERTEPDHPKDEARPVGETSSRNELERKMSLGHDWQQTIRQFPWVCTALFVATVAIYVQTLTPGVLGGDVGELQFVPYILGMAHPTGTPFYCLLGKLWTMLPLGATVAWRMNLLSAISASLAIVVVCRTVHRRTARLVPALVAALSLAFGNTFWEQATMADKYAFNALLVALVLHLALRWGETRSPTTLNLLALTYGLSLTHHRTMLLFAPTLLGYVWWYERGALWRDWRRLLRLAALFIAPLLFYLYLPWAESRNLPPGTWHPRTLREWYHYIMDTGQIGYLYIDPADLGKRLLFYAQTLQRDFTWIGVLLGLGGLFWQFRHRRSDAIFLLASFGLHAFLAANHHLPRQWTFFIPSFLIFALWLGGGLGILWKSLDRLRVKRRETGIALSVALSLAMLALPLIPLPERYRSFRAAHDGAGVLDVWRQAIKQGLMGDRLGGAIAHVAQDAIIVCDWEQATPLWYFQQVEGLRLDVQIVYPVERLEEAATSGRPLYLARNHPGLVDRWHPSSSGPLIALRPEPTSDLPLVVSPLGIQLGDSFELVGFTYEEADFRPATVVPLMLYWQALQTPLHDYSVSVRLFDKAGQEIYKVDSQHPVLGTYPTSKWSAGEVVGDYYEIQLPPDLPPGLYHWGVILYRSLPEGGWENLEVGSTGTEVATGGFIQVRER